MELKHDWDPRSEAALGDQVAVYDEMRRRCPVAHSEYLHWSLFRHGDVTRVLEDHHAFSNAVSSHLSVPNGMDPPEHTEYRRIIVPYFSRQRMEAFEPACRDIAVDLANSLPAAGETELMTAFARDFSLQIQSAFLGWPMDLHEPLRQWIRKNHAANLAGDKAVMDDVAVEFDGYIKDFNAAGVWRHG